MRTDYAFTSRWTVPATPARCWALLEDALATGRVRWWPAVRVVPATVPLRVGDRVRLRVRSPLGYALRMTLVITDAAAPRLLAAGSSGDLAGRGRLCLDEGENGTRLTWTWEVDVRRRGMRLASPVLRPVFAAAHRAVMRRGERGFAGALRRVG